MKKLVLCVAIAAFSMSFVNAQEVKFGVKAGVNFASFSGDDVEDLDGLTGFHVGGVAEIMFSDKFSIQPEIIYSAQGAKSEESETFEGETFEYKSKAKLDYINIPVIAKYYVTEGLSLEAGPQVGFLASAKGKDEVTIDGDTESDTEDLKEYVKGVDFGLGLGLGYKLENGLNFSARYNLGLANISDDEDSDDSLKNNVIQLSVGFMF
ncbi:porin family protein [Tamlana sp. I1]|uniref:porin family protein n=1 Tax=Tamlana sp. I1 TaxID=2762061 RepID=UPI00188F67BD|nr:porin family protein [Tamlana sp. I1]